MYPSRVRCIERTSKFLVINNTTNFVLFQENIEHLFLKGLFYLPFTIYTLSRRKSNAVLGFWSRSRPLIYKENQTGLLFEHLDLLLTSP